MIKKKTEGDPGSVMVQEDQMKDTVDMMDDITHPSNPLRANVAWNDLTLHF